MPETSLRPIDAALSAFLNSPVAFAGDCVAPVAEKAVSALAPGGVLLLEKLRSNAAEEETPAGIPTVKVPKAIDDV